MTTARLAALRAKVQASSKVNSAAQAENIRLKAELKEKQEEYKEVLLLKKETLESLSGSMYEAENNQLRKDIAAKEEAILKEMAAIEAMLVEEEEVPTVTPELPKVEPKPEVKPVPTPVVPVTPQVKPESNGKAKPPEDGGARWLLVEDEDEDNEFNETSNGWTWLSPDERNMPVEFWGPKVGITQEPDSKWSTHFRVVKR